MIETGYAFATIAAMTAVTFGIRLAPFILAGRWKDSRVVRAFNRWLPAAIMAILVVYVLKDEGWGTPPYGLPAAAATLATAGLQLAFARPILSIVAGTAIYMGLGALV